MILKSTVSKVRSRASTTRVYGSDVHCKRALNGDTLACRRLGTSAGACLTATPAFLSSSRVNVMYCVIRSLLIGFAEPENIASVGSGAEITLVSPSQLGHTFRPQKIVCVTLFTFSGLD